MYKERVIVDGFTLTFSKEHFDAMKSTINQIKIHITLATRLETNITALKKKTAELSKLLDQSNDRRVVFAARQHSIEVEHTLRDDSEAWEALAGSLHELVNHLDEYERFHHLGDDQDSFNSLRARVNVHLEQFRKLREECGRELVPLDNKLLKL